MLHLVFSFTLPHLNFHSNLVDITHFISLAADAGSMVDDSVEIVCMILIRAY
jgi:hypothetical protein